MQAEKEAKKLEMRRKLAESNNDDDNLDYSSYTPSTNTTSEQEDNRIVLKLRDKNNYDISMRVKPVSFSFFCYISLGNVIWSLYYLYV